MIVTMTMTQIEEVKEILPDVNVRIGTKLLTGHVQGRKNQFATVLLPDGRSHEFSWTAIARAYFLHKTLHIF